MSTASSYFDMPPNDIVPQRSPTVARPASLVFPDLNISDYASPTQRQSRSSRDSAHSSSTDDGSDAISELPPQNNRASAAYEAGMPSLSNTPSSSIGTAASWSSYRPLPPRHDPSTGHHPKKSIDLVMPTFPTTAPSSPTELIRDSSLKSSASTITSFRTAEAGVVEFAKRRPSEKNGEHTSSSLKQLLNRDSRSSRNTED